MDFLTRFGLAGFRLGNGAKSRHHPAGGEEKPSSHPICVPRQNDRKPGLANPTRPRKVSLVGQTHSGPSGPDVPVVQWIERGFPKL